MRSRSPTSVRLLALPVAILLIAVGVAVPLLDAGEGLRGPVFESEHHASSCVVGHDHTICTQVGTNQALEAGTVAVAEPEPASFFLPPTPVGGAHDDQYVEGHRSRAPPLARA